MANDPSNPERRRQAASKRARRPIITVEEARIPPITHGPLPTTSGPPGSSIAVPLNPPNWRPPANPPLAANKDAPDDWGGVDLEELEDACVLQAADGNEPNAGEDSLTIREVPDDLEWEEESRRERMQVPSMGTHPRRLVYFERIPHPESDYHHEHAEGQTPSEDDLRSIVDDLNPGQRRKLEAYQRMRQAFQFIVCTTMKLMWNINQAVAPWPGPTPDYAAAAAAYNTFLDDMENPGASGHNLNPADGLGYGRCFRNVKITPTINRLDPDKSAVITGVSIKATWNPHYSSSGVPVRH